MPESNTRKLNSKDKQMLWIIVLLLALIILGLLYRIASGSVSRGTSAAYFKNSHLFSPAERSFFGVLDSAIGSEYALFGKVRVADILSVAPNSNKSHWQRAFNKIKSKHFDFVICEKTDFAILAVVELDDKSHNTSHSEKRDSFLVNSCAATNLPLFRFVAKASYNPQAIREQIMGALRPVQPAAIETPIESTGVNRLSMTPPVTSADASPQQANPICPKCALPMIRRTAKSGTHERKQFWACTGYPKCRSITPI
jgi:hypothetical protein